MKPLTKAEAVSAAIAALAYVIASYVDGTGDISANWKAQAQRALDYWAAVQRGDITQ